MQDLDVDDQDDSDLDITAETENDGYYSEDVSSADEDNHGMFVFGLTSSEQALAFEKQYMFHCSRRGSSVFSLLILLFVQ